MTQEIELFPPASPTWQVITCHHRQTKKEIADRKPKQISHHELLYDGQVQKKATGDGGLEKLRFAAAICNKGGHIPRPAIQCLADESGSLESAMARQTKRADAYQRKLAAESITPTGTP